MKDSNEPGFKYQEIAKKYMNALDPEKKVTLDKQFTKITDEELTIKIDHSQKCIPLFQVKSNAEKATFLNTIAEEILMLGDVVLKRAVQESELSFDIIVDECKKTVEYLRNAATMLTTEELDQFNIKKVDQPIVFYQNYKSPFSSCSKAVIQSLAQGNATLLKADTRLYGTNALLSFAIQQAINKTNMPQDIFQNLSLDKALTEKLFDHAQIKIVALSGDSDFVKKVIDEVHHEKKEMLIIANIQSC